MTTAAADIVQTTSASNSVGTITLSASAYSGNPRAQAFPAVLDGHSVSYLIEHSTVTAEWELGEGVYTHSSRQLTRPAAKVSRSSAGAGANVDFSSGGLIVSLLAKAEDIIQFIRFRGGGVTINEVESSPGAYEFVEDGTFAISSTDPKQRAIKVLGPDDADLTGAMWIALPDPDLYQEGDEHFVEKGELSEFEVTVVGFDSPLTGIAVSTAANTFTLAGHGLANDDRLLLRRGTLPTSSPQLVAEQLYWVVGVAGNAWQLSATLGGAAIDLTSAGSGFVVFKGSYVLRAPDQFIIAKVTGETSKKWERTAGGNQGFSLLGQLIARASTTAAARTLLELGDLAILDTIDPAAHTAGVAQHRLAGRFSTGSGALEMIARGNLPLEASPSGTFRLLGFNDSGGLSEANNSTVGEAVAAPTAPTASVTLHQLTQAERAHVNVRLIAAAATNFEILDSAQPGDRWEGYALTGAAVTVSLSRGSINGEAAISTSVSSATWGTPSGNNVTITAPATLPVLAAGAYFTVRNHNAVAANNGTYIATGSPTASSLPATKLSGSAPQAAAAEAVHIEAHVTKPLAGNGSEWRVTVTSNPGDTPSVQLDGETGEDRTLAGDLDCADHVVSAPELKDVAETAQIETGVSGAKSWDYRNGAILDLTLSGNVTSAAITNPPATSKGAAVTFILRNTSGRSFAWPPGTKWPGGSPPTLSSGATDIDEFVLITRNAGTEWLGHVGGQDFS